MSQAPPSDDALAQKLREAIAGLTYPSESDEPFDLQIEQPSSATTAKQDLEAQFSTARPIEPVTVEAFFQPLADSSDANRFQHLRSLLQSTLTDLQIFRIGPGPRVDVYLIGQTADGRRVTLYTVSVET